MGDFFYKLLLPALVAKKLLEFLFKKEE